MMRGPAKVFPSRDLALAASARVRLVCFPHAAGNATLFRGWGPALAGARGGPVDVCAVELAGRGRRFDEAPATVAENVIDEVTSALRELPPLPTIFFGHSLGARLAFGTAVAWSAYGPVEGLVAAAARAPVHDETAPRGMAELPRDELIAKLADLGGTPPAVLEHADLMDLLLPMIRADLTLAEWTTPAASAGALACPVTVLLGREDASVGAEAADGWRSCTRGPCSVRELDGGHFFVGTHRDAVLAVLVELVSALALRARPYP